MCGRFSQHSGRDRYAKRYGVAGERVFAEDGPPRYNLAPSASILVVRLDGDGQRELVRLKWGMVPHWSTEPTTSYSTINARAETVDTKPAFRTPFKRRRCIIPADGWYEWAAVPGAKYKRPWYYTSTDGEPLAFAGLWDRWQTHEEVLESCTIIVCSANGVAKPVHDRMPVILTQDNWAEWLAPTFPSEAAQTMLAPCPDDWIKSYPVGRAVSLAKNEGPELIAPAAA